MNPEPPLSSNTSMNPENPLSSNTNMNPENPLSSNTSMNPENPLSSNTDMNTENPLSSNTDMNPKNLLSSDTSMNPGNTPNSNTGMNINPCVNIRADIDSLNGKVNNFAEHRESGLQSIIKIQRQAQEDLNQIRLEHLVALEYLETVGAKDDVKSGILQIVKSKKTISMAKLATVFPHTAALKEAKDALETTGVIVAVKSGTTVEIKLRKQ